VPSGAWRWIESGQTRLLRHGAYHGFSAADLLICAPQRTTTSLSPLDGRVLQHVPDLRARSVYDTPEARER
jgi:hypothetical protein